MNDGKQNTATPTKNTISVIPAYIDDYYSGTAMPEEAFIEKDINWFRLRDISLNYAFPQTIIKRIKGFKTLGVFVTATDLVLITNYSSGDPSTNGNTAGSRGVGAWGFDYGTLPAPISFNFGIRAGF